MIRGTTFEKQESLAMDDAHIFNVLAGGRSGVIKGCGVSVVGTTLYIAPGTLLIKGRLVTFTGTTSVPNYGVYGSCILVCEIDLSKVNTDIACTQLSLKVLKNQIVEGFPTFDPVPVIQDLDNGGTLYQFPLCSYEFRSEGITDFSSLAVPLNVNYILSEDSGWIDVTTFLLPDWNYGTISYRKKNGVVDVILNEIKFGGSPSQEYMCIPFSLPAGFKPSKECYGIVLSHEQSISRRLKIKTDGSIVVGMKYESNNTYYWTGSISFHV